MGKKLVCWGNKMLVGWGETRKRWWSGEKRGKEDGGGLRREEVEKMLVIWEKKRWGRCW